MRGGAGQRNAAIPCDGGLREEQVSGTADPPMRTRERTEESEADQHFPLGSDSRLVTFDHGVAGRSSDLRAVAALVTKPLDLLAVASQPIRASAW